MGFLSAIVIVQNEEKKMNRPGALPLINMNSEPFIFNLVSILHIFRIFYISFPLLAYVLLYTSKKETIFHSYESNGPREKNVCSEVEFRPSDNCIGHSWTVYSIAQSILHCIVYSESKRKTAHYKLQANIYCSS